MRPISLDEVYSLRQAKQIFCDCYLVSSLNALTRSKNGVKILQENIQRDGNNFCIRFNNIDGHMERYLVREPEWDELILLDKYLEPVPMEEAENPILKAVEIAMNKLLKLHPNKKSFISNIPKCQEKFEYNKVSNFLTMFTGVRPISLNEYGIKMNLLKRQKQAENLLNEIGKNDNFSFVAGTGYRGIFYDLPHCYTITGVYPNIKLIELFNGRFKKHYKGSYNQIFKNIKYICGYFDHMLEMRNI